jgi:energy-coupling factor transport system permease protein
VRGIEFSRNVSIGQYLASDSYVHRLTPATKYLWLLSLMTACVAASTFAVALAVLAAALAIGAAAGLRPGFLLRGIKPILPLLALVAALQFLFAWPGDLSVVLFSLGPVAGTLREARIALMAVLRALALMAVIGLFTSITSESQTVHGIEDLLKPLARLGLPARRLSLAVGVAFRFIPVVALELESIVKAQASRGADFGSGRGGPIRKARAYLPLLVPVTLRALERAELLAQAMEARGYSEEGVTRYANYVMIRGEILVRLAAAAFCAAALAADALASRALARTLGI